MFGKIKEKIVAFNVRRRAKKMIRANIFSENMTLNSKKVFHYMPVAAHISPTTFFLLKLFSNYNPKESKEDNDERLYGLISQVVEEAVIDIFEGYISQLSSGDIISLMMTLEEGRQNKMHEIMQEIGEK